MKTLLICPAIRPAVSQFAEIAPLATLPMFGETLVGVWLEHLASQGVREVTILVSDRHGMVRTVVGDGRRWGVDVKFLETRTEPTPTEALELCRPLAGAEGGPSLEDIVVMNHLPGARDLPLFDSYSAWFAALVAWMPHALTPARVRMREAQPGVWMGSGARVAPSAQLLAPCWIGDDALIEDGAIIGPRAIIEDRAVVSAGAHVTESAVGPDTFVGRLLAVTQSLAVGSLLVNWKSDSTLRVPDSFLLSSLAEVPPSGRPQAPMAPIRALVRPLKFVTGLFSRSNRAAEAKLSSRSVV